MPNCNSPRVLPVTVSTASWVPHACRCRDQPSDGHTPCPHGASGPVGNRHRSLNPMTRHIIPGEGKCSNADATLWGRQHSPQGHFLQIKGSGQVPGG